MRATPLRLRTRGSAWHTRSGYAAWEKAKPTQKREAGCPTLIPADVHDTQLESERRRELLEFELNWNDCSGKETKSTRNKREIRGGMNPNQITIVTEEMANLQNFQILVLQQKLREARAEIEKLRNELKELRAPFVEDPKLNNKKRIQYWGEEEHAKFLEALELFDAKKVKEISQFLGTRSPAQVRSHAQKHFLKVKKQAKLKNRKARQGEPPDSSFENSSLRPPPIPIPSTDGVQRSPSEASSELSLHFNDPSSEFLSIPSFDVH
jgi:SHAQKYF class myb-like DNA-binding protein